MQYLSLLPRRLTTLTATQSALRSQSRLSSQLARPPFLPRTIPSARIPFLHQRRYESALTKQGEEPRRPSGRDEPSYDLTFTCKPCLYRSTHRITKQGYHHGTVLITCPSCSNRHVISDHLRIFLDAQSSLEDILKRKLAEGEDLTKLLKKGKLGMRQNSMIGNEGEEDIEFWEDGTETYRRTSPTDPKSPGEQS
ncbi:hypothetical protein B0A52_10155 [Exophiala mesophila]|uniref:DNL-type domain-containing protein n=1 Tax=Exophiala mesophila TaxID=212818 RepID=A0A438MTA6_EXOME|nr:hypothetical protein B0A52_10155 [Exophiala mesophila]